MKNNVQAWMGPWRRRLIALSLIVITPPVMADSSLENLEAERGNPNYDESLVAPWIEQEIQIPDPPEPGDLHPLQLTGLPPGFKLFLDLDGITFNAKDGVIRLWMVLRSSAGNDNTSYEGYRCSTGEYKVFAYANARRDPPVRQMTRSTWRSPRGERSTNYRRYLMDQTLCGLRGARPPVEIQQAVRRGQLRDPLIYR